MRDNMIIIGKTTGTMVMSKELEVHMRMIIADEVKWFRWQEDSWLIQRSSFVIEELDNEYATRKQDD